MERSPVQNRFNVLQWHDSKLLAFSTRQTEGRELFVLDVEFVGSPKENRARLSVIFTDVAYLRLDVDFDAKWQSSDVIASAYCVEDSPLLRQVDAVTSKAPGGGLQGYLQFHLTLLPPTGQIDVFAKSFDLAHAAAER